MNATAMNGTPMNGLGEDLHLHLPDDAATHRQGSGPTAMAPEHLDHHAGNA